MAIAVRPFLMFQGDGSRALELYVSLFDDAELISVERYGPSGPGAEGGIQKAELVIAGQTLRIFDSPAPHAFSFTPSISLFVDCEDEDEIDRLAAALGEGGQALMPLGSYGFSRKFAWLSDRFGVSWQLNLA